jgi:hypothetical protein
MTNEPNPYDPGLSAGNQLLLMPPWLMLLLNEASSFQIEAGCSIGGSTYIYYFPSSVFINWLSTTPKIEREQLVIYLRIQWDQEGVPTDEFPRLLLGIWHKSLGKDISSYSEREEPDYWQKVSTCSASSFYKEMDYLVSLAEDQKWIH